MRRRWRVSRSWWFASTCALAGRAVIQATPSCPACTMHSDHPGWSLPAHCRGTLRGMDAA
ncbi:hypothetical protein XarjCFBP7653_14345 [Xanthomonas arboricola]|nr:hypothetical protein XarjCFBP7653_14345 [Xanthomonas arboricola]